MSGKDCYPTKAISEEICIGTKLTDGRVIKDILWSVHLANKKGASYVVVPAQGVNMYGKGKFPHLRNNEVYGGVDATERLITLIIDPGPRAISTLEKTSALFDYKSEASHLDKSGNITALPEYPINFPIKNTFQPSGKLEILGEIKTDNKGRLLVLPGFGRTAAQYDDYGNPMPLTGDLNNAGWFDDTADGPVSAVLLFEDETTEEVFGGWVVCCGPSYAPQIRNVVSVWDDVFDTWLRQLELQPEIFDIKADKYNYHYEPSFEANVRPIFRAANLQRWTTGLPKMAIRAHEAVDAISPNDNPDNTIMAGLNFIRNPNADEFNLGTPLMPLSVGDAGKSFLTVTKTQYFFLEQWSKNKFDAVAGSNLSPGEYLDMAALSNCLGGRYVPGIEISYIGRCTDIYMRDWKISGAGPFRIKNKPLDYLRAQKKVPLLSGGWFPLNDLTDGLEPGDVSKFMAIPWQADYNSCSIHQPSINTNDVNMTNGNDTTLYWSWPAQRPDSVYVSEEVIDNVLPQQQWAIRGPGTYTIDPASASAFQNPLQAVKEWDRLGIIIQGTAISDDHSPDYYLEVQNKFNIKSNTDNPVLDWPFNTYE